MAILQTRCPTCRQKFGSTKGFSVGRVIHCPKCDADFTVTDPNAPALPTQATAATVAAPRPAKPTAATNKPAATTQPSAMAKPAAPAKPTSPKPAPLPLSLDDEPAAVKPNLVPLSLDDDPPPPRKRGPVKIAIMGLVMIALGVGGFVGIGKFLQGPREHDTAGKEKHPAEATPPDDPITPPPPPEPEPEPLPPYDGPFPRRLLFIHISKYQYLNPLTNAASGATDQTRASALAFAARWKIPADKEHDQVFLLSDTATGSEARVPVKEVIRGSYERFFDTSRPQDHIVVYFGGHAVEWNGKAYFAPIDGEFDEPTSLIPVDEIYAKLRACKATEKVVIWDVCRFNPQRGRLRPGSEPMSPSLAKLLAAAPSDIEVMTTCKAGENALEFSASPVQNPGGPMFSGSLFLEAFKLAGDQMLKSPRNPQPTDAFPLAKWAPVITKHAGELAKVSPGGGTQTITIAGKTPSKRVAFNAADPLAKRFEIPEAPKKTGPPPPSADVDAIVREFSVPAVKLFGTDVPPPVFRDRPDALTGYKADVTIDEIMKNREKYQFRVTVIEAFDAVRSLWRTSGKGSLSVMGTFSGPVGNNLKRNVKKDQDSWAVGIAVLEAFNDRLDTQMKERALQPKRWQAHYDYARALVKSRLAYLNEYNKMLGDILTETLPSLDEKQKQDGYKLVSTETARMKSKKDIKQLATEAAELYDQIIAERQGTPWADQARRDRLTPLGMAWHPYASKP